jgi:cullin 3
LLKQGFPSKSDDFEAIWTVLSSSLSEIHTKNASALSFEELYRNAYKSVLMQRGNDLYSRVKDLEQDWLKKEVRRRILSSIQPVLLVDGQVADALDQSNERRGAGEKFLRAIKAAWEDHQLSMSMITDVLMYMVCYRLRKTKCGSEL